MSPVIKAMLIPFVRIGQTLLGIVIIALMLGCVYGLVLLEKRLINWNWRVFIVVNVTIIYVCIVWYCLEKRSEWWP